MKNKFTNNELRKRFYKEQCEEMEGSPERFAVYENDGELVADYWLKVLEEYKAYLKGIIEKGNIENVPTSCPDNHPYCLVYHTRQQRHDLSNEDIIKLLD